MKKRILSIVLSIVMLVGLLPTTALAADTCVMVGGVEMYSAEGATYYKNGDTTLTGTANDWNAKFDPTTSTLYIKNLSVTGTAASNYAGILSTVDLNIVLEGANSVTGGDPGTGNVISAGIYASGKDITISGSGTLSATGGAATGTSSSCGIFCDNLTLEDSDIVINAAGGSVESGSYFRSCGIYAGGGGGGMNISAGIVNATGDNIGISCSGGTMYISGSAVINAIGGTATGGASSGISAYTVEISGGTVNAIGGTPASDNSSVGFYGSNNITISGGVVNATGGDASAALTSAGIEAADVLTVTDGVLNATGGSAKTISSGIGGDANGNTVTVSGGIVVATGGSAGHTSFGHYGSNGSCSIQMSGGVLVARAGAGTNGSVALCEAPELNGARIAGQVAGGSFTGSSSEFNENATAVAIVPDSYTVQNTELTNGNAADYTIATATAVVVNDSTPLSLTAAGSAVTLNGDLVLINLQYETQVPAFYLGTDVTVSGSGTLTAIGAANKEWSYGVAGTGRDLSVNGAKIIAIGGPASTNSYGIGASVNVNVSNNGSVIAIGGGMTADDANSYGIGAGSVSVSGTGEITAVAGMGKTSAGINGKLNAGGTATVTAVGGVSTQANGNSCGIYGATTVQGSTTVNALGGAAINSQSTSFGISGAVTVGGGTVNAVGNTAKIYSYGIGGLLDGAISITAGTVNAVGGIADDMSFGIQSGKRVSVSAGSAVNAVGRTYGLRTASGTLAGGNFAGGSKAVSISDDTSNVNALLADGCGYFAGSTQLEVADSATTVGSANQTVTVKQIPIPHVHPVCGAEHNDIGNHTGACGDITWTALSTVLTYDSESGTYRGSLPTGNYYLDKDMTVKGTSNYNNDYCIDIQGTTETPAHVNLCLNGHQLTGSSGDVTLHVSGNNNDENASLSICDCYDADTHTGEEYTHTYTSPISGAQKTVNGGLITGATGRYARTMYANDAQVNFYGGTIAGNGAGENGGGAVYMSGVILCFYDGSITDNYMSSGGVLAMEHSEAHLIDGCVTGNAAYEGVTGDNEIDNVGGVHLFGESTATIHSGFEISSNKAGLGAGESIDSNLLLGNKPTENSDLYIKLTGPMEKPIGIRVYEPGVFTSGFGSTDGVSLDDFVCEQRGYFLATEGEGDAAEAKLEPYAITTQPTTNAPQVATNNDDDVTAYSWHSQASATVDSSLATALDSSICTDGVWSGEPQGSGYEIYFFTMALNAGDTLTATLVNDAYFDRITLDGDNTDDIVFSKNEAPYVFEISATDTYRLWVAQADDNTTPTFSVTRSSVGAALAGQTTATLTGGTDGETYVCKVTFEDGTVLVSEPVEYDAPAVPTYTVTVTDDGNGTASASPTSGTTGTEITLTATPASGYHFKEWQVLSGGVTVSNNKFNIGTENVAIKAVFEADTPGTYTVTYLPGANGTGAQTTDTKTQGIDLTLKDAIFTCTGYTQTGWATTDGGAKAYELNGTYSADAAVSLYPVWTANTYAVTLNTNGATITDGKNITSYTYGVGATLPVDGDMAKASHRFDGWYESADFSGSPVTEISATATGNKTYYAKWTEVHTITGVVKDSESNGIDGVTVKLMQGNDQFGTTTTADGGQFSFTSVPLGSYNVVAVQSEKTKTELVIIPHTDETLTIVMPSQNVSSTLNVSGSSTPDVVVGGLDDEAADQTHSNAAISDTHVSIGMSIEAKEDVTSGGSGSSEEASQQTAIKQAASEQQLDKVEFLSITVTKTVTTNGTPDNGTELEQTQTVLELIIPYSLAGKYNIGIYRHHDGRAEAFAALGSQPDEQAKRDKTFWIDTGKELIHIYTNRFSNYAIAYSNTPGGTPAPDPTPSGGDYTPTYAITVEDAENGEAKANRSYASSGSTVTITVDPEAGYVLNKLTVKDDQGNKIEVTGKGDGTYTFKMPSRKVTVTAAFVSDGSYSTCPGDHTCPIWPYTDAEATAWYHDGVHYCIENGLMTGYGNGIFKPNTDTSRAMIAVMLWRLEGSPVVNYLLDFEDVKAEAWYTEAIRWAKSEGIIGGYGNGCWGPDDAVTREQMVTILWRYAQYKGYDVSVGENTNILSYDDAFDVAEYAIPAMQWACGSGMVQGMNDPDGEGMILAPESKGTRAQIATMIMRFCEEILK